jgi:hypothetical protein
MAVDNYCIGTTYGNLTNVENLTPSIPGPEAMKHFQGYTHTPDLGNGLVRGGGFPKTAWHWGFLSAAQRDVLRSTYCSGKSSNVYIRTTDGSYTSGSPTYKVYQAVMIWPDTEDRFAGRSLDITIEFRNLVYYPET